MVQRFKSPLWASVVVGAFAVAFAFRYLAAVDSGVSHVVAIRTYTFWALVALPVACLVDMVMRSVLEYRFVQLALARIQRRRHRHS